MYNSFIAYFLHVVFNRKMVVNLKILNFKDADIELP